MQSGFPDTIKAAVLALQDALKLDGLTSKQQEHAAALISKAISAGNSILTYEDIGNYSMLICLDHQATRLIFTMHAMARGLQHKARIAAK